MKTIILILAVLLLSGCSDGTGHVHIAQVRAADLACASSGGSKEYSGNIKWSYAWSAVCNNGVQVSGYINRDDLKGK